MDWLKAELEMRVGVGAGLVAALVNGFCLKWAEYMLVLQSRQRLALARFGGLI